MREEQVYFAEVLIGNLVRSLDRETRLSEFKKTFKRMLAESSFEI